MSRKQRNEWIKNWKKAQKNLMKTNSRRCSSGARSVRPVRSTIRPACSMRPACVGRFPAARRMSSFPKGKGASKDEGIVKLHPPCNKLRNDTWRLVDHNWVRCTNFQQRIERRTNSTPTNKNSKATFTSVIKLEKLVSLAGGWPANICCASGLTWKKEHKNQNQPKPNQASNPDSNGRHILLPTKIPKDNSKHKNSHYRKLNTWKKVKKTDKNETPADTEQPVPSTCEEPTAVDHRIDRKTMPGTHGRQLAVSRQHRSSPENHIPKFRFFSI